MCSIVISLNDNRPQIIRKMVEAVRHRGPDSFEVWTNYHHGVGGCRLSIFGDPKAPMIYQDQETGRVILLNGEIYNYEELWNQLRKKNIRPTTTLESELISRLYNMFGLDFAAKLKGMFAIAILDGSQLVLARDRFGIKPLYYTRSGKKVLVCSEIKGLLRHPSITPILNQSALEETKVFGYIHSKKETIFKGIFQVPPGIVLSLTGSGLQEQRQFGMLPLAHYLNGRKGKEYKNCVREIRQKLIQATERMFQHGTMDKGIYLSGGLDSSTMAWVARRYLSYQIKTFTLADNLDSPDLQSARKVAKALGTDHYEYVVDVNDYWRWLPDYVAHYESLMAGGVFHIQGGLAFHILSKYVAQHVCVAFSGEGADELFGGYYWDYTHPLGFSDRIKHNFSGLEGNIRLKKVLNALFPEPEDERIYRQNIFDHLIGSGLTNYHLQSVDRSGGAFGFEIRPLYLEDNLSQWAMELPIDYKVPDKKTTKKILRDAFLEDFRKDGLEWVANRYKMGMPSALARLDKLITSVVEQSITDEEVKKHPLGKILESKMNLFLFDLFEHIFFKGWDPHEETPPKHSYLSRIWPV